VIPEQLVETPQPATPRKLDKPKLLIGEGKDEVLVFEAFLSHLGILDIQVEDYCGKDRLPDYLDALSKQSGFAQIKSIGVTRDADADAAGAFASLCDHLSRRSLVTPAASGNVRPGTPSVGVMIFPDGKNGGMLEDLCLAALGTDSLTKCIDVYFNCVEAAKNAPPKKIAKARIHAWLAAQEPPDLRLGMAAQKGLIPWNNNSFDQLRGFLTAL